MSKRSLIVLLAVAGVVTVAVVWNQSQASPNTGMSDIFGIALGAAAQAGIAAVL
jgi:hypothetical protein